MTNVGSHPARRGRFVTFVFRSVAYRHTHTTALETSTSYQISVPAFITPVQSLREIRSEIQRVKMTLYFLVSNSVHRCMLICTHSGVANPAASFSAQPIMPAAIILPNSWSAKLHIRCSCLGQTRHRSTHAISASEAARYTAQIQRLVRRRRIAAHHYSVFHGLRSRS